MNTTATYGEEEEGCDEYDPEDVAAVVIAEEDVRERPNPNNAEGEEERAWREGEIKKGVEIWKKATEHAEPIVAVEPGGIVTELLLLPSVADFVLLHHCCVLRLLSSPKLPPCCFSVATVAIAR
ncbi:hypothetical protein PIB30_024353 [Stylosanthes scabra]|uniref:Uncharacterized protein n=1 Tax=Stylosanthes scabra TaxID=79078 RepID=A0ABU6QAA4_9FABA|nr:hypothetical protein [Stylosanthes scabra]